MYSLSSFIRHSYFSRQLLVTNLPVNFLNAVFLEKLKWLGCTVHTVERL